MQDFDLGSGKLETWRVVYTFSRSLPWFSEEGRSFMGAVGPRALAKFQNFPKKLSIKILNLYEKL